MMQGLLNVCFSMGMAGMKFYWSILDFGWEFVGGESLTPIPRMIDGYLITIGSHPEP